jgi:hypothetical protein
MHGHSHGNINQKADCLTNLGALGETIEAGANFFFAATLYDTAYEVYHGHEIENPYGGPLYLGIFFILISLGTAYTHRRLDAYHQNVRLSDESEEEHICNHDHSHQHDHQEMKNPSEHRIDIASSESQDDHAHDHENPSEHIDIDTSKVMLQQPLIPSDNSKDKKEISAPKLTRWQKLSLFSDASSHVIGRAGLLTGMVDGIATIFTKNALPPTVRLYVQGGSFLFGAATSASGIRTCWNTMLEQNHQKEVDDKTVIKKSPKR